MELKIDNRVVIPVILSNEPFGEATESKKWQLTIGRDDEVVCGYSNEDEYAYEFTLKEVKELIQTLTEVVNMAEYYTHMRKEK